jgi:hypothetical protein
VGLPGFDSWRRSGGVAVDCWRRGARVAFAKVACVAVFKRLLRLGRRSARPIVSISLIVAFLSGTSAIPVKVRVLKDRSQPFPCQDNPCGCSSADECWHHCCCHTNREKLAWAREHGVTPPDFVIAAAEKEEKEASPSCCQRGHCAHCASAAADHDEHNHAACARCTAKTSKGTDTGLRTVFVISDLARRCAGMPIVWSVLSSALPVQIRPVWSFDTRIIGSVVELTTSAPAVDLSPPVPPPKLGILCG